MLRRADPKLKAEVYADLGLQMTYHPERATVAVEIDPARSVGFSACRRGDLNPHAL